MQRTGAEVEAIKDDVGGENDGNVQYQRVPMVKRPPM
jgi:hypothetical protein